MTCGYASEDCALPYTGNGEIMWYMLAGALILLAGLTIWLSQHR